jgi:RNA polymerase sigma factor (sigma-70 family)
LTTGRPFLTRSHRVSRRYDARKSSAHPVTLIEFRKTLSDSGVRGCLLSEMQEKSDAELLREYAARANDAAFREIVTRHADLVYASALRQVSSPELARDIAQTVFADLVRKAPALGQTLAENASLVGWLYRSTRFEAHTQLRDDRRRQARERQAMENFDAIPETATEWERVGPVLDEAMADLSDEDREALLLRFFKNHDFRAIGVALGVSDDAAQKRVSRALDRLRAEFHRRGVTTTAVALSAAVSAHAVSVGPAGLAASLSTAVFTGTTAITAVTATTTKAVAMTILQKTLITAAIVAAVGTVIYEAQRASRLRDEIQSLQRLQAEQLSRERDEAASKLAGLREENERLNRNTAELLKLRAETARLRGELKSAEHVAKNKLDAERAQPVVEQTSTNPPPVEIYLATARAVVPWNQALISGGWKTLSGKIVYILAVPTRTEDAAVVKIETRVMEVSVEAATKLGLDQSNTGDKETKFSAVLTTELCDAIVRAANDTNAVAIISSPRLTVFTGRQAQIQSMDNKETRAGEKYSVGPTLTFMPTISADGQSVDLGMIANVKYPSPAANQ